jgi:hypothetical protein
MLLTNPLSVVLSGSADFQLRIWSALDGINPVTLKGHRAGTFTERRLRLACCIRPN